MAGHSGSGYGDGSGYGYGYGYGDGSGYGYGYGDGDGNGAGYGYGYGDPINTPTLKYACHYFPSWSLLKVGCEIHTIDDWISKADEIDAIHGDGIAGETRALAMRLKNERE